MKRFYKSVLSVFLCAVMIFSIYMPSVAVETDEVYSAAELPGISVSTLVPEGEVSETGYQKMVWVDENGEKVNIESSQSGRPQANHSSLIPSKYSSKDSGYCSAVRNQGGTGSCWAFSAVASAESNLLRKGIVSPSDNLSDLSEAHLVWFTHKSLTTDVNDPTFGDGTNVGSPYSAGGDWHRSTYTLARGAGLALEKDYPFYPYNSASMGGYDESKRYDSKVTLNEAFIIPGEKTDEIKKAVMDYGSVSVAALIVTEYFNGAAYYQDKYAGTNHQMIIVGWDDNYSVDNFRPECKPSSPGAWLVKNSYDTTFGENGYNWISYEEPSLDSFFVQDVAIKNENEDTYQYDGYGYDMFIGVPGYYDGSVANVFTAEKIEAVESVGFYTLQDNVTYEISVYKNVTYGGGSPVAGGEKFPVVTEGVAKYSGYHKVKLDQVVPVSKGETFSVIVRMRIPEGGGNSILIPFEGRDTTTDGYQDVFHSSKPGQSFFTLGDLAWSEPIIDKINYNNVCVKAFTIPDNTFEISTAEEFNSFAQRVSNGESFDGRNINLIADIDFAGGKIIPVGTESNPFKGYFLGNGHVLKNGEVDVDSDYVGVFSVIPENSEISKLGLENISVNGIYGVGALCGYSEGKISHCYSTGTVTGEESVGGLVGVNAGKILSSYSICTVTGEYDAGSFIGEDDNGEVSNCYVSLSSPHEPIYNGYGDVTKAPDKCFSNGLVAFNLDEGKSPLRAKVWTKRDGVTTFLKSADEIIYQVELYDKSNASSLYLYVNSYENLKELAEAERHGQKVTIYADPKHKVPYNSTPGANVILYAEWTSSHDCASELVFISGKQADCYNDGIMPHYACSCGKIYLDENAESEIESTIIFSFFHPSEYVVKTEKTDATCTEDGNIEYYTCTLCNDVFSDVSCTESVEDTSIPATGHSYSDWKTEKEADCTSDGLEVKVCVSCADRIEHIIPASGHSYGEWHTETEADCENDGLKVKICSSCGDRDEIVIPADGHDYKGVIVEPTENEMGYTTFTCSVCGDSYIGDYIHPTIQMDFTCVVTSYLSQSDEVLVELIRRGEAKPAYSMSLAGNSGEFTFENILSGAYTVRISKNNHTTREYTIIIEKGMEVSQLKIHPVGDVNGDGKVNSIDVSMINAQAKGVKKLESYYISCADVTGDGKVNSIDVSKANAHSKGVTSVWK